MSDAFGLGLGIDTVGSYIYKTWLIRGDDARRRVEKRVESCGRCRRGPLGRSADIPNRDEARQLVLGLLHPARHGRAP